MNDIPSKQFGSKYNLNFMVEMKRIGIVYLMALSAKEDQLNVVQESKNLFDKGLVWFLCLMAYQPL